MAAALVGVGQSAGSRNQGIIPNEWYEQNACRLQLKRVDALTQNRDTNTLLARLLRLKCRVRMLPKFLSFASILRAISTTIARLKLIKGVVVCKPLP